MPPEVGEQRDEQCPPLTSRTLSSRRKRWRKKALTMKYVKCLCFFLGIRKSVPLRHSNRGHINGAEAVSLPSSASGLNSHRSPVRLAIRENRPSPTTLGRLPWGASGLHAQRWPAARRRPALLPRRPLTRFSLSHKLTLDSHKQSSDYVPELPNQNPGYSFIESNAFLQWVLFHVHTNY